MGRVLIDHRAGLETPHPYRVSPILRTRFIDEAQGDIILPNPVLFQGHKHLMEARFQALLGLGGPTIIPWKRLTEMDAHPLAPDPNDLSRRILNPKFSPNEFPYLGGGPRGLLVQQVV